MKEEVAPLCHGKKMHIANISPFALEYRCYKCKNEVFVKKTDTRR